MSRQPPGPYFYLRPDEDVLLRERPAPGYALLLFVFGIVVVSVLTALALMVTALLPDPPIEPRWYPRAGVVLALLWGLVAWRRWATTEYAITDERIYARRGRLITAVHFTTHDKVTDLRYRQGPLERVFGISRLTLATAGGDVTMAGLKDAVAVKETAEQARDQFVRDLLEQAGLERRERAAPAPPAAVEPLEAAAPQARPREPAEAPEWHGPRPAYLKSGDVPVWLERPRPVAAVGSVRAFVGILVLLVLQGAARGTLGLELAALLVGLFLVIIGLRLMQLRRMEYVATDRRVYSRSGVLGTTVNQLTYDKITDITYRQDFLGRILGYGSVTVNTAGSNAAPITMEGLAKPLDAKETIERWRDSYLQEGRG